jgi:hypothetical protein
MVGDDDIDTPFGEAQGGVTAEASAGAGHQAPL